VARVDTSPAPSGAEGPEPETHDAAYAYIRAKVNQLLEVMGTLPVRPEELDDATLLSLDPIGIVAESFREILTHLKETNENLGVARDELQAVLESAGAAILVVDSDARIELCNGQANELLSNGQVRSVEREIVQTIVRSGSPVERADLIRNTRHYHLVATPLLDGDGAVSRVVFCYTDITEQKEHQRQLEHIAHYDTLTDLPNRVLLADRLRQAMYQAQRRGRQLAVAYLDLDGFKAINDTHGHEAGDRLLSVLAGRMKRSLRQGDTLARLGGDEFVAVLIDLEDSRAGVRLLARLLDAASQPVHVGGLTLQTTASLGVAFYPLEGEELDPEQLMRHADQAMYQAKVAGKNRYHVFDAERDRDARGRHESVERIRLALERREFVLHYQPKVDMRTGELLGAEALIRWQHPERGLLAPASFLTMVEDHPLSIDLDEWVLEEALTQIETWADQDLDLPVSVNVGAMQLQQLDFSERLAELLRAHPAVAAERLTLEVLETSALKDVARVSQVMRDCLELGVKFALDDFGTGYSSLTYLKQLPASELKIDRSFVSGMLEDAEDLAILEGVLGLVRAFRRDAIAEGVETVEHGEMLLRFGCTNAQGYYIARPMPATQLPLWAADWRPPERWASQGPLQRQDLPLLFP